MSGGEAAIQLSQTRRFRLMRLLRIAAAIAALAALSACDSHGTEPTLRDQLAGQWFENLSVPGAGLYFSLVVVDTTISGSGSFSIEAGPSGTISVTGVVTGGRIKLNIARSIGDTLHFDGVQTDPYDLDGYGYSTGNGVVGVSDPAPVKFIRLVPID
ncbi:MAG: hypothetical protein ABI442_02980 [Gemmatimonadaceae bacterium]